LLAEHSLIRLIFFAHQQHLESIRSQATCQSYQTVLLIFSSSRLSQKLLGEDPFFLMSKLSQLLRR